MSVKRNSWTDQRQAERIAYAKRLKAAYRTAQALVDAGALEPCRYCNRAGCVECRGLGAMMERKGE